MSFRRHDLLDVAPDAWATAVSTLDLPAATMRVVVDWVGRGRPVIVRRRLADAPPGQVPVGLQLPNAQGRGRIALTLPRHGVTRRAPVTLAAAAEAAPSEWAGTIAALLTAARRFGAPTVYGGLLWHYLTGETVLRDTSDLDVLWSPPAFERAALLDILSSLDGGGVRVDGELMLEDGAAVSWRELRAASAGPSRAGLTHVVLAKTIDGIEMRDAAAVLQAELASC